MRRCAEWTADEMRRIGLQNVRLIETPGNPVVYGEWLARAGAPTILFYGHYDVQPVDPLDLWESPPFEATVRDGEIYARGAADDKGQVFMHFKAIEAHMKQNGRLPVNMKVILEGEEEVGSANLDDFIRANKDRARGRRRRDLRLADVRSRHPVDLLRPARPRLLPDRPARHEERPALRLVRRRGREPGVRAGADPGADEGQGRPHQDSRLLRRRAAAARRGAGRVARSCRSTRRSTARSSARRSCSARAATPRSSASGAGRRSRSTGCSRGFTGEGAKTVIPAVPMAKVSMRLVPDQDPDKIAKLFEEYVQEGRAEDRRAEADPHARRQAVDDRVRQPVRPGRRPRHREGLRQDAGVQPRRRIDSGRRDIPGGLGLPTVLFGVGLPDENAHAPNEKLDLGNFHNGIIASAHCTRRWRERAEELSAEPERRTARQEIERNALLSAKTGISRSPDLLVRSCQWLSPVW